MRLIVLVHCSDGDVMVSARPQPGTLFYLYFGGGAKSLFRSVSQNTNRSVVALAERMTTTINALSYERGHTDSKLKLGSQNFQINNGAVKNLYNS